VQVDCNGNPADSCETNLSTDPNHCGSCDKACPGVTTHSGSLMGSRWNCADGSVLTGAYTDVPKLVSGRYGDRWGPVTKRNGSSTVAIYFC
jgi:hypothetical protein